MPTLAPVALSDFDAMVAIRIEALRESLERLGRFDPVRARERLAAGFVLEHMRHIELDDERIGKIDAGCLHAHHHLARRGHQGRDVLDDERIGQTVLLAKHCFHGEALLALGGFWRMIPVFSPRAQRGGLGAAGRLDLRAGAGKVVNLKYCHSEAVPQEDFLRGGGRGI